MPWKVSLYDSVDSGCDFLARMPPANWRIQCVDFPCDSLASRDIADAVVFPANFASRTFLLRLFACFWARKRHMASSKVILKICLAVPSSLLLFLATSAEGIFPGVPLGNLKDGVLIQSCWKKLEWLSHWGQLEKTFKSVI